MDKWEYLQLESKTGNQIYIYTERPLDDFINFPFGKAEQKYWGTITITKNTNVRGFDYALPFYMFLMNYLGSLGWEPYYPNNFKRKV